MKRVVVGIIGSGFAADLHACAYQKVYGVEVVLKAVASLAPNAGEFAAAHGIAGVYTDYREMLKDPEIDVIDVVAPPFLHEEMIKAAIESKKHVICEKPLTGYFEPADGSQSFTKEEAYREVQRKLKELGEAVEAGGVKFMYAENYIYTPALQRSLEFLNAQNSRILFMRAEESHNGSHAAHAALWKCSGGGSFIRQGCHPLSAVLYLKEQEARKRGAEIRVTSVMADMGNVSGVLNEEELAFIETRAVDVEDLANVLLTFSDGSRAVIMAGDMVVGGVKNLVEIYTNKSVYYCNMAATDGLRAYHDQAQGLENVYVTEKLTTKTGWQNVFLEEELMRGYTGELQDFMECVAFDRQPKSGFELAAKTALLVYAAYHSAETGRRVSLEL